MLKALKVLSLLEQIRESERHYGDTSDAVSRGPISTAIVREKGINSHSFRSVIPVLESMKKPEIVGKQRHITIPANSSKFFVKCMNWDLFSDFTNLASNCTKKKFYFFFL